MDYGSLQPREYLLISDFDQTLSFNDSGIVLSELLGIRVSENGWQDSSNIHLVQQGGELPICCSTIPNFAVCGESI